MGRAFYEGIVRLLFFAVATGMYFHGFCQNRIDFTPRTSQFSPLKTNYQLNGDFAMIGNTNLQRANPPNELSNTRIIFIDTDSDPLTQNSSSATLKYAEENGADHECTEIVYAGLYWAGRTKRSVTEQEKRSIKIKGPGQSNYQELTARSTDIQYRAEFNIYVAYTEVTELVEENGTGEYWVADMALSEGLGNAGFFGGWSMVVIYRNPEMQSRNIIVNDGYALLTGGGQTIFDIPIDGFHTPPQGNINMKIGVMAGEGDLDIDNDFFQIQKSSNGSWFNLEHQQNTTDNFFNSSIELSGINRNPVLTDNAGIDISVFDLPNTDNFLVSNNQTSVNFRCNSKNDSYAIFLLVMSVNSYFPVPEGFNYVTHINGNKTSYPLPQDVSITPGQIVEFKFELRNLGKEAIDKMKIVIPIPFNAEYVESNAEILFAPTQTPNILQFDPLYGERGALRWDIGTMPLPEKKEDLLATLNYSFKVSEDCMILQNTSCNPFLVVDGEMSGVGADSDVAFNKVYFIQGYNKKSMCEITPIEKPLKIPLELNDFILTSCNEIQYHRILNFSGASLTIPTERVAEFFPPGAKFFNSYPPEGEYIEYNAGNPFPGTGNGIYFAVPPESDSCFYKFEIVVRVSSVPQVENLTFCQNAIVNDSKIKTSNPIYNLYYFDSPVSNNPIENFVPSTDKPGLFRYYVAEGFSKEKYGPKQSFEVKVYPSPKAFVGQDVSICQGDTIKLGKEAVVGNEYYWTSDPPGFSSSVSNPLVTPQITTRYSVIETIKETGCADTAIMNTGVTVYPNPVAFFNPSDWIVRLENAKISFKNESSDAVSYKWDFGDGSGKTNQKNPFHIYEKVGKYLVNLTAFNKLGCSHNYEQEITVTFDRLYPPTAFSPNSYIASEQVFNIDPDGILPEDYHFQIYNRWGGIVFESHTKGEAWNGTMLNGAPAPAGVYTWVLQYKDFLGLLREQEGTITLVYQKSSNDGILHLPNAFSPTSTNPDDREFKIMAENVSKKGFNLKIYNRWGTLVFETSSPEIGWDGKMKSGNPAPSGTYMYVLQYTLVTGNRYQQKGNLMLVY